MDSWQAISTVSLPAPCQVADARLKRAACSHAAEFSATLDGTPVSEGGVSALAMVVNGRTWPKWVRARTSPCMRLLTVLALQPERTRMLPVQSVVREPYRLRLLNGCNARALVLYFR